MSPSVLSVLPPQPPWNRGRNLTCDTGNAVMVGSRYLVWTLKYRTLFLHVQRLLICQQVLVFIKKKKKKSCNCNYFIIQWNKSHFKQQDFQYHVTNYLSCCFIKI